MLHPLRRGVSFLAVFLLALFGLFVATSALGAQRTFVHSSPVGNDANTASNCSLVAPCRSFNAAISVTDPSGEVVILDTAGYGSMVINKAIKVIGPSGVYGGISVLGAANPTTGVVINAGDNDDITLRGLDISGVPGAAPLPLIGIDIQNAGGVHIEKSSIGNFNQDTSACINLTTAKTVRLYVIDSFLRACRVGVQANGTAVAPSRSSVVIDNTRFERARSVTAESYGIWLRDHMSVTLRNSQISRVNAGVQVDHALNGATTSLHVVNSELTRLDRGITFNKTATNSFSDIHLTGSQIHAGSGIDVVSSGAGGSNFMSLADTEITGGTFGINYSNSGVGHASQLKIMGGQVTWSPNGIVMTQTAADANTRMYLEIVRATVGNITNPSILASASNGSKLYVNVDSVMFGNTAAILKTAGNSQVSASIVRSQIHNCTIVVDHGSTAGIVRVDGNHIVSCTNDFVNSGNGTMASFNNNFVFDVPNTGGFTYIAPPTVSPR